MDLIAFMELEFIDQKACVIDRLDGICPGGAFGEIAGYIEFFEELFYAIKRFGLSSKDERFCLFDVFHRGNCIEKIGVVQTA